MSITIDELAGLAPRPGKGPTAHFTITPAAEPERAEVDGVLAGVAQVDITPPPGMPKAGFSKNAHDGIGFRNRLRARVLHLRSGTGSVAWVQLDLLAGSSLLQHLIAHQIADRTDIGLSGIILGATHTHAGPGHFDASDFYNRFAANRPGFDPAWTAWLAERISAAIVEAHDARRPARVATGRTAVWGSTRNRSLAPFVQNIDVEDRRLDAERRFGAVNPWLHLVRVDSLAGQPLAAWAVFSIHGTGVNHHNEEYHADVWAYLTDELHRRTGAVAAAVEGTHADVAPALRPGRAGFFEAERIGRAIGVEAALLHARLGDRLATEVTVASALREVDLDAPDGGERDGIRLPRPALGASQVAGAKENLTPVIHRLPPFRAGHPKPTGGRGPHGPKWILGSQPLQSRLLPLEGFPRVLSFQAWRIGELFTVGFPFEITVVAGRRIAEATAAAGAPGDVVVASVTNGYCGYCTTAEEYALQYYEGGHNLHGPRTQEWLGAQGAALARDLADAVHPRSVLPERRFALHVHRYLVDPAGGATMAGRRRVDGAPRYVDAAGEDPGYWEQRWIDGSPGTLAWHEPMARVEVEQDGTWSTFVDDQRTSIGVVHRGKGRYAARWYDPWLGGDRRFRFVITTPGGDLVGAPFWCGPAGA